MYWQTLRPLQNLNSIFHTVKNEPRVSRITSPNKNLACEKATIVILAMQVARFSAYGNIWGESGRGLPVYRGSGTTIGARPLADLSLAHVFQGLVLSRGKKTLAPELS